MITISPEQVRHYLMDGPRYTSYPTVPHWKTTVTSDDYAGLLRTRGSVPVSLYVHVPFCQKRCFFCACNVIVKKYHPAIGDQYVAYLKKEIDLLAPFGVRVAEIHFGGGTPTYLSDAHFEVLMTYVRQRFDCSSLRDMSIEIDPRRFEVKRFGLLRRLGFNRVSFGVQDLDPDVQTYVHRFMSSDHLARVVKAARKHGFDSINMDLIYGLPGQTAAGFSDTLDTVIGLRPDRLAMYSFAYLPSLFSHQHGFKPELLPSPEEKIGLFLLARDRFLAAGYVDIAMDHFATPEDGLAVAYRANVLRRTFMGYTDQSTEDFLGIGVSAIGSLGVAYVQNHKSLPDYYHALDAGMFPVHKGIMLSRDDQIRRFVIVQLMCQSFLSKGDFFQRFGVSFDAYFRRELSELVPFESEGLLSVSETTVTLTDVGTRFVRRICMVFDAYLRCSTEPTAFSKTI